MLLRRFSVSAIALAIASTSVYAVSPPDNDIERVVVTGSRVAESIDEVPASITIINQQQIQEHLKVSPELQSLLAMYVPGMGPDTGSSSNTGQSLRGRSPLIMIDGVPQSTPLRNGALGVKTLDPSAIERIEVIKGATSIFGNGAAGGIINYITRRPVSDNGVEGEVSLSSRFSAVKPEESAGARVEAVINGRYDAFTYLLTASYEENGVQRDAEGDILGLQYGLSDAETQNYFTKLGYEFDEEKTFQASFNFYSSQQKTDLGDIAGNINDGEKTYAIHVPEELQKRGKPQGPDGNTNLMVNYTDTEVFTNTQMSLDYYQQNIENIFFFSPNLANPGEGYEGGQSIIKSDKKGARATFNTQWDFNNIEATWIYGIDALNDITSQPLVDGRVWVPEMDMDNLAGFLQTKWIYSDDLVIKLGVRREFIDLVVDDYNTLKLCRSETQCSIPLAVKGDTLEYSATTYNAGIKYTFSEAFKPFLSYSEGADISDIGRLLRSAVVEDIADIRTEASVIKSVEVGFDSQIADNARVEFSLYRSKSELGTTNKFDPNTGVYMPVRAPERIWGYEALLDWTLSDTLNLVTTYSYVEGKNTEADVYLGAKQISPPKATMLLNWRPLANASLNVEYLYVGERKRFEANEQGDFVGDQGPVSSYNIVNLSGKYLINDQLTAFAGIQNLFNEDYFPARAQAYTYGGYNIKGLGTTLNLGVSYSF